MRLADLGFGNASLYLCDRVLQRLSGGRAFIQRYYLMAQPVKMPMRLPQRLGANFRVRRIAGEDPEAQAFPRPPAVIAARYAQGSTCLALYDNDELAGFIWLCPGPYLEDEVRCTFMPVPAGQVAWDYDLYILPEYRNGVAFMKLWSAAMEHLQSQGVAWSASRISAFAPASIAVHKRLGAVRVGQAFFFVFFGLQLMVATLPPFVHLSASRRSSPALNVRAPAGT
jgi:GNAT superfamily N-acetyltransferase